MAQPRILLVDDDPSVRFTIRRFLASNGYDVAVAESCAGAMEAFRASPPDAAVLDYELPDGTALDLLRAMKEIDPLVPLVILTGHGSIDLAVRAVKDGAEHFLTKPADMTALTVTLQRALQHRRLLRKQAVAAATAHRDADPFLGVSAAIRRLSELARKVAASDAPVLITGETGSGKGVLARWLHSNGPRADEPFVDLNCAGLNHELLESELFGHERGAFTSATASKLGLLEAAHRGTVFLDEIGDMDLAVQPKLLKAVEEKTFRRVGEVRDRTVDIRLLAATHRDLRALVDEGRFRADLFFRINAVPLAVPALRDRPEDIPVLARRLLEERPALSGLSLSEPAIAALQRYRWPGNVRELRNVLERAALLGGGTVLGPDDLLFDRGPRPAAAEESKLTLGELERVHIERVLRDVGGRVAAAAERLGIPRSTLYLKLKQHGLSVPKAGRDV
ncbi:MAG TPA: sigma-54 dependent transcriptional regulator [Anaeromyxobacteraceae bacterium]|nr:sigma-54 dependent transcriptional regulator [Anaeromyxobacteraceae bacterium]